MWFEINVDLWQWILSQALGLVGVVLLFITFQAKTKSRMLFLQAIAVLIGAVSTALLENYVLTGLLVFAAVRNFIFLGLDKYEKRVSKLFSYFTLAILLASVVLIVIFTRTWWYDWVIMVFALLTTQAKWMKGEHLIRITSLMYSIIVIVNHIAFMNLMGLVIDVVIIISIVLFYIKLKSRATQSRRTALLPLQE